MQNAPESKTYDYSFYEEQSIQQALRELRMTIDPHPEGKKIERIIYRRLPVVDSHDPLPSWLNRFHTVTLPFVLRQEMLVHVGEPYRKVVVDETARNLRRAPQLSVVLIIALHGSSPDRVVLLVITKDVWSLRLNTDIRYSSAGLERFSLQPAETNLLGTHHTLSALMHLNPAVYGLGGGYSVPRFTTYQLRAALVGMGLFNRRTNELEGTRGTFFVERPLLTSRSRWAWNSYTSWDYERVRRFVGVSLARYDAKVTPDRNDDIPDMYDAKVLAHRLSFTRSFGWANKFDWSFGFEYFQRRYDIPAGPHVDPAAMDEYRHRRVPTSDTRLGPYVKVRAHSSSFVRLLDVQTLALQEDYQTGHDLFAIVYPSSASAGSDRTMLGVMTGAQYTVPLADGFVRGLAQHTAEFTAHGIDDALLDTSLFIVTPRVMGARLVERARLYYRYRNYLNQSVYLGGDGALRGYPSNYDVGSSFVMNNVELRTGALSLLSCQVGAAAFYDLGDAFYDVDELHIKQSAGIGLRALFPQLDKVVFRADLSFPVASHGLPPGVAPASFFVSFRQAFFVPKAKDTRWTQ